MITTLKQAKYVDGFEMHPNDPPSLPRTVVKASSPSITQDAKVPSGLIPSLTSVMVDFESRWKIPTHDLSSLTSSINRFKLSSTNRESSWSSDRIICADGSSPVIRLMAIAVKEDEELYFSASKSSISRRAWRGVDNFPVRDEMVVAPISRISSSSSIRES